jgi:TolB protein
MRKISASIVLSTILTILFVSFPNKGSGIIDIVSTNYKKTTIAIPDMTVNGKLATTELSKELTDALRFDLDNSGWFTTTKDYAVLRQALEKDLKTGGMNLADWRKSDAELLIKADLSTSGKKTTITCRGYDLISGNKIFEKGYGIETNNPRYLVHYVSDQIVETQTGRQGIARTKIAFVASMGTKEKNLYIMDYDGHNVRKLSNFKEIKGNMIVVAPDWAPDGNAIYFTSYHLGYPYVYRINLSSNVMSAVSTFPGLNASAAISPNGSEMALALSKTGTVEIHKKTINSKTTERLTRSPGSVAGVPRWSPDGGQIAFVSSELGAPQIFVMDSNGGNKRRLVKGYSYTTSLDWSPKGDLIAFSANSNRRLQLFIADVKKNVVKQLTSDGANNSHPSFAPDGIHIMYTKEVAYSSNLHIIDIRDLKDVEITNWKGDETYPSWSPVNFNRP